jgi:DNA-binding transcriptional LysR family regulator
MNAREVHRLPAKGAEARGREEQPGEQRSAVSGRLFQRTTRKLTLTEAGESFLARVGPLVEEMERAREEVASIGSEPSGTLRVSTSVAFGQICLVPLLPAFRRAFPRLRLELLLTDTNVDLIADRIDLAI